MHKGDHAKAARHAGCPAKQAKEQGYQLYTKLHLYINPLATELVKEYAIKAEQVLQDLSFLASSDNRDYVRWDHETKEVRLTPFEKLTPQERYCLESVKMVEPQFTKTIELPEPRNSRRWRHSRCITTCASAPSSRKASGCRSNTARRRLRP